MAAGTTWGLIVTGHVLHGLIFGAAGPTITLVEWRRVRGLTGQACEAADYMLLMVLCTMLGFTILVLE
jgi:hypothetical protein